MAAIRHNKEEGMKPALKEVRRGGNKPKFTDEQLVEAIKAGDNYSEIAERYNSTVSTVQWRRSHLSAEDKWKIGSGPLITVRRSAPHPLTEKTQRLVENNTSGMMASTAQTREALYGTYMKRVRDVLPRIGTLSAEELERGLQAAASAERIARGLKRHQSSRLFLLGGVINSAAREWEVREHEARRYKEFLIQEKERAT